jgi:phosphomannomutase
VRASGTEPKLTARCEAGTEQALDRLCTSLADRLEGLGLDPQALR